MIDYYQVMQLSKDATQDEIKQAYRKLAKRFHPDANKDNPEAEWVFKQIGEAYSVLSDKEKKSDYDNRMFESSGNTFTSNNDTNNTQTSRTDASMSASQFANTGTSFKGFKLILKIIAFPIRIAILPIRIAIFILTTFIPFIIDSIIVRVAFMLVSGVIFIFFLVATWSAIFVQTHLGLFGRILIPSLLLLAAYLTNPNVGLLSYVDPIVEKLKDLNDFLKFKFLKFD